MVNVHTQTTVNPSGVRSTADPPLPPPCDSPDDFEGDAADACASGPDPAQTESSEVLPAKVLSAAGPALPSNIKEWKTMQPDLMQFAPFLCHFNRFLAE